MTTSRNPLEQSDYLYKISLPYDNFEKSYRPLYTNYLMESTVCIWGGMDIYQRNNYQKVLSFFKEYGVVKILPHLHQSQVSVSVLKYEFFQLTLTKLQKLAEK